MFSNGTMVTRFTSKLAGSSLKYIIKVLLESRTPYTCTSSCAITRAALHNTQPGWVVSILNFKRYRHFGVLKVATSERHGKVSIRSGLHVEHPPPQSLPDLAAMPANR